MGRIPRYRRGGGIELFVDSPTPNPVAEAVGRPRGHRWDADAIRAYADRFSEERFIDRIRAIVGID